MDFQVYYIVSNNRYHLIQDREEEMRRREERRRQIEAESNEEDSGDLPAWKKEIMMKRGGTLKNWGDEREDINETEQVIYLFYV